MIGALRQGTRELHHRLHVHPFMTHHFMQVLTPTSYAHFLSAFFSPWSVLLPSPLGMLGPWLPDALSPLRADLEALNHPTPGGPVVPLNPSEVIGYAYTLVSSSLGGCVLARHVHQVLPDAPTTYLDLGISWSAFKRALGALERSEEAAIVAAARACFEDVSSSLDEAHRCLGAV